MIDRADITIVYVENQMYVKKRMLHSFTKEMCESKKAFVDYLYSNHLPVARIIGYEYDTDDIFELQEYIHTSNKEYSILEGIDLIGQFHKLSRMYKNEVIQKKVLEDPVFIGGVLFDKTLIGFKEKYYLYARKTILKSTCEQKVRNDILLWHQQIYDAFLKIANTNDCIIHNDLTSQNMIMSDKLYLIDFDFVIRSSVYVDVADVILPRSIEIEDYLRWIKDRSFMDDIAKRYNYINAGMFVKSEGLCLMAALKIYVYIMYIYSQSHSIDESLYEYMKRIKEEVVVR